MRIEYDRTEVGQTRSDAGSKAGYMTAAVSGVLVLSLFMACLLLPEGRMRAAAEWVISVKGLAVPLLVLVTLAVAYIGVFLIYRLVGNFINRESSLRLYMDRIIRFVGGMCGDFLFHILQFIRFIPDFLGWGHQLLSEDEGQESSMQMQESSMQTQKNSMHMQERPVKRGREFWSFINICAVFLAGISLYTTAEGMSRFFFRHSKGQAWLISLAIQGILLALNLRLPAYLIGKARPAKACAIGLYAFTILWSAGFSYIFMANVIYEDTWMKDAQIEISGIYQQTRQELADRAQENLELAVGDVLADVTALQAAAEGGAAYDDDAGTAQMKTAMQMPAGESDTAAMGSEALPAAAADADAGWIRYHDLFAEDARMLHVMEQLDDSRRSVQDTQNAVEVLTERKASLTAQLTELAYKKADIRSLYTQLDMERTALIDKRARVPADSEAHVSYTQAMEEKTGSMEEAKSAIQDYETQEQDTLDRKSAVEAMLAAGEMAQESVAGKVSEEFAGILAQIGSSDPDMDEISRKADLIYMSLVTSAKVGNDTEIYGDILEIYLRLGNNLHKAADIRDVLQWTESRNDVLEATEKRIMAGAAAADAVAGGVVSETEAESWRTLWNEALAQLKEKILLVPKEQGTSQLLRRIDRLQRNYLLDLNEVERAGNYLFGSYPAMAWFSLFFALYLDSAPMLLAVFKYCSAGRKEGGPVRVDVKHTGMSRAVPGVGGLALILLPAALLLIYK